MASQQMLIAKTIAGMKRTLKRKADGMFICYSHCLRGHELMSPRCPDDESEPEIERSTNRGNKLQRGSRFIRQGHLTTSSGPLAYKEVCILCVIVAG